MKNLLILLKTNFINSFGINKVLKQEKKKMILSTLLIIFLAGYLLFVSTMYANMIANALIKYNLLSFMLTIFFIMATFATFMFTIHSAKSGLFNANDNDMLLSMPINSKVILASRLIRLMVSNLITSLFIVGPAVVVYALNTHVTASYYLFAVLIFLLLPVIPTVIASIIGYFIAYITSKSNSKNWIEIIISFVFIFAIMLLTSYGNKLLTFLVSDMKTIETILKWGFYPIYLVNEIFSKSNYLSLLIFVIINLLVASIFVIVLSRGFKKITAKLQENKTKSNYKMKSLEISSVSKALFIKDLKRYLASPIYVLNTSFGVVIIFIISIASLFYDKDKILQMMNINMGNISPYMMAMVLVAFVTFLSNTTSSSISIEGKNYWIMKSLPINPRKILDSKVLLNLLLVIPIMFISIVILKFSFVLTLLEMLSLFIVSILASLVTAHFGLIVNLKFPKMEAISDTVIVKRSISTMIATFAPMVLMFMIIGIYSELGKNINFNYFVLSTMALLAVLIIVERIVLKTWGIKRFKEIN
jgi:ABC-2 type transport system permease protein